MSRRFFALALLLCCLSASTVQAQSFDCTKSQLQVERWICGDRELSKLDEHLAEQFAIAQRYLDKAFLSSIRDAQRRWLAQRNACQNAACVLGHYRSRARELGTQIEGVEREVVHRVRDLFLGHVDRATNVSIPDGSKDKFTWGIDWPRQQAYCQSVWAAFTKERQRLVFPDRPAARGSADAGYEFARAWTNLRFEQRGCHDEFPFTFHNSIGQVAMGQQLYDHSPDWVMSLRLNLAALDSGMRYVDQRSYLQYALPAEKNGHRCNTSRLTPVVGPDLPYAQGGIENVFALVDNQPLLVAFGIYGPDMDESGIEKDEWPAYNETEESYFVIFGKRRGRLGQGFVAVQSHQVNLYRTLALEPTGYEEDLFGVSGGGRDGPSLLGDSKVRYEKHVCVINFDLH